MKRIIVSCLLILFTGVLSAFPGNDFENTTTGETINQSGLLTEEIINNPIANNTSALSVSDTTTVFNPPPAVTVQIGNGFIVDQNLPWEPWYRYSYSQTIYYPDEINRPHGEAITTVAYHYNGNLSFTDLVQIYMGYTNENEFASTNSWLSADDLTLVFDGEVTTTTHTDQPNWLVMELDTPFFYSANSNLVIAVREYQGGYWHTSTDDFYCQEVPLSRSIVIYGDDIAYGPDNHPEGLLKQYIPNTILAFAPAVAGSHLSVTPAFIDFENTFLNDTAPPAQIRIRNTGSEPVTINSIVLNGNNAEDFQILNIPVLPMVLNPVGVIDLTVLHTPGATGERTANITITDNINKNTTIIGLTSFCADYTISEFPYLMNFDNVQQPALPPAWYSINSTTFGHVKTVNSLYYPNSNPNHISMYNNNETNSILMLITPAISEINQKRLSFYAKKSLNTNYQTLIVGTIENPSSPDTFLPLETIELSSIYTRYFISLADAEHYRIAFKHPANVYYQHIFIDDITFDNLPQTPVLSITPQNYSFGETMIFTSSNQSFTLQNIGIGTLSVESITISGDAGFTLQDEPELPLNLNINQSTVFSIQYNPLTPGEHSATITITDNLSRTSYTVEITGQCFNGTQALPYFSDFDNIGFLHQINWTGDVFIRSNHGVNGSNGLAKAFWSPYQMEFAQTCPIGPLTENAELRFLYRIVNWLDYPSSPTNITTGDSLNVKLSTDGINFTTVLSINNSNHTSSTEFAFANANLSDYANQIVFLKFEMIHGGISESFYDIDEVVVRQFSEGADFYCPTTEINFGNILQFNNNARSINIHNFGNEQLTMNINLPEHMTMNVSNPISISPENEQRILFFFTPQNIGAYTGNINITTNCQVTPSHNITVVANILDGPPADYIQIGASNQLNSSLPWRPFSKYTYTQSIYYPYETNIPDGNIISSVSYHYNGSNLMSDSVKVFMGYTNQSTFNSNNAWVPLENLSLVFDGGVISPSVNGWFEIVFEEEFVYSANQNLVIAILEYNEMCYNYSSNNFYGTSVQGNRSLTFSSDGLVPNPANPESGTPYTMIPNTRIKYEDNTFRKPQHLTGNPGNNEIHLSWNAPVLSTRNSFSYSDKNITEKSRVSLSSYKIYKNGQELVLIPATQTSFTDFEVMNNIVYTYFVTAIYSEPEGESNSSNQIHIAPNGPVLSPPTAFYANVSSENSVILSWAKGNLILNENFETAFINQNWINLDYDYDGQKWEISNINPKEGYQNIISRSRDFNSFPLNPNNWIISPSFFVTENTFLNYWIGAESQTGFAENYLLVISTNGSSSSNFETVLVNEQLSNSSWQRKSVELSDYNGMIVNVGFIHNNSSNQSALKLDGIQVVHPASINTRDNYRNLLGFKIYRNGLLLNQVSANTFTYLDQNLPFGEFEYLITAVYSTGESSPGNVQVINITTIADEPELPLITKLKGNYPNPFNPETTINFDLAKDSSVLIEIFNIKGQKVYTLIEDDLKAGQHRVVWNGTNQNGKNVSSGVYFYKMQSDDYKSINKMLLIK